jgi:hypothetical protein
LSRRIAEGGPEADFLDRLRRQIANFAFGMTSMLFILVLNPLALEAARAVLLSA